MPESNLEIVRRSVQAAIDRDWHAALEAFDTSVELRSRRPSGLYRRRSGVWRAMQRWSEVWVDRRVEAEEFIDAGEQIVVITHEYAKSDRTGMALDRRIAEVWTLRDGKVVVIQDYPDRDEALAATGLSQASKD
jgi:ketosteroid isomerase-like protein